MFSNDEALNAPHLTQVAASCEESRLLLNRRALLGMSAGLFSWASLPKSAGASEVAQRRLLVVVLRGALDGLHVAYNGTETGLLEGYRQNLFARNASYLSANYSRMSLNSEFMLHNKMTNFGEMFRNNQASLIHAIAPPLQTRSHFDCQANLESGQPSLRNVNNEGWLSRFVQGIDSREPLAPPLSVDNVPLIIKGKAPVQSWTSAGMQDYGDAFLQKFVSDYARKPVWQENLRAGLALNTRVKNLMQGTSMNTPFAVAGMLMSQDNGPRIAALAVEGLDTHANQITMLDRKLAEIDSGLQSFKAAMSEAAWNETVVVCVTEFGRTVRDNAGGTDHGVGTVAFLAGGNVAGGRVLTDWPSITGTKLVNNADLRPTYDTRYLFRSLLKYHMGCHNEAFLGTVVFPGTTAAKEMRGLVLKEIEGLAIKSPGNWPRA